MGTGFSLHAEALPGDARVVRFVAREALSQPFEVEVDFDTRDAGFDAEALLFSRVALTANDASGGARVFDGIVEEAGYVALHGDALRFRLRLLPQIGALAHRVDSRIFQGMSVVEVVRAVLDEAGFGERVEYRLVGDYEAREMIVQYAESDLAFVSRLCEDEGIYYFFEHDDEGHTLVFGDHDAGFTDPERPVVLSRGQAGGGRALVALERVARLRASHVHLRDFDLRQPAVPPEAVAPDPNAPVPLGHYEYAGAAFSTAKVAQRRASARLAALRSDADRVVGEAVAVGLLPGHRVHFDGFPEGAIPPVCTVVSVTTTGEQASERASGEAEASRVRFECIAEGRGYAPPQRTPRPRIRGYQVATVTGPTEVPESIHCDDLGRIKIRFPWDRSGLTDDRSSAWVRVSQLMLGGAMILPRVGWEVVVSFEQGDPDRPLVLGKVYTAEEQPPAGLPAAAADGSFATRSSPGGAGRNGIVLGDSAGKQGFSVAAQKDMNTGVGANRTVEIGVNESIEVGGNAALSVGASATITVGGNQSMSFGDALQVTVKGAQSVTVGGSETLGSTKDYVQHAGGATSLSVGGTSMTMCNGVRLKATGAATRSVGSALVTLSAGAITDESASSTESVGAVAVTLAAGKVLESHTGARTQSCSAAELVVCSTLKEQGASITKLVGGLHLRKVGGDVMITGSEIALGGAMASFKAGGSSVKLAGGPITIKASSFKFTGATIKKTGATLKEG